MLSVLTLSGTYVDEKITPGFYYRVKRADTGVYLFDGEARRLISVGMGYGKRITFQGKEADSCEHFYSDTEPKGRITICFMYVKKNYVKNRTFVP